MARVRAVFKLRGTTWLFKAYKDADGVTKYIYEPQSSAYKPIQCATKLDNQQLLAQLDEQEFRWYNRNPRK